MNSSCHLTCGSLLNDPFFSEKSPWLTPVQSPFAHCTVAKNCEKSTLSTHRQQVRSSLTSVASAPSTPTPPTSPSHRLPLAYRSRKHELRMDQRTDGRTDAQTLIYRREDASIKRPNAWQNKSLTIEQAEYSASDAPGSHLREGVTDRRTDGPTARQTDGWTDTPSYRDATAHLKRTRH